MSEIKHIDPRALGSITSGILLLDDFSKVHEAIEWVIGHPVWTHEMPAFSARAAELVKAQYPGMPLGKVADWKETADFLLKKHGFAVPVKRGDEERSKHPMETLLEVISRPTPETSS